MGGAVIVTLGIDGTLGCHGGGALIVTVWGLMEHWSVMGEGILLSLSLCEDCWNIGVSWGRGSHCHFVGIDRTLVCHGGGVVIVTVWGLMEHWVPWGRGCHCHCVGIDGT